MRTFDALLWGSFGGPEGMADVMPFLENVLRGKPVSEERKKEVAHHYEMFGGVSPINQQNRILIKDLDLALKKKNIVLPIFWGNRNWTPYFHEALEEIKKQGHQKVLAFFTSAYSSYSGCRQYRENISKAREQVGENAPEVFKLRSFFNHPLFIEANASQILKSLATFGANSLKDNHLIFTAHSIPTSMSATSDYVIQLEETARLVAERLETKKYKLVYQSRSGGPGQPWLEPDVCEYLKECAEKQIKRVVVSPIGFVSDHMEVIYDLDVEAKDLCSQLGIAFTRSESAGTHPLFIDMIVELIEERLGLRSEKRFLGNMGPRADECAPNCCAYNPRPKPQV